MVRWDAGSADGALTFNTIMSVQQLDPVVEAAKRHNRNNGYGHPPEETLSTVEPLLFVVLDLIREAFKHITSWGETGLEARMNFSGSLLLRRRPMDRGNCEGATLGTHRGDQTFDKLAALQHHPPYNRGPEAKRNRCHSFHGAAILAGGDYTHNYWQTVIGRQFAAALQMLRSAIEACPDDLWDDRAHGAPFWHLAYHALFYADFYLSDNAETFQSIVRSVAERFSLQDSHVDKAMFLPGDYQQFGGVVATPDGAFTRSQLLEYADHCLRKSDETFKKLTDNLALERCGFPWYNLNVGEFLLNNLRHTQHHTGQLVMLLRRHANIGIDWLGTEGNQPPPPTW